MNTALDPLQRMADAEASGEEAAREEGIAIALEAFQAIEGIVQGIHVTAPSRSDAMTSSASRGSRPRSRPSRTRSIPMSPGSASTGSFEKMVWFPMATPYSLTPCSKPQTHHGEWPITR